jgi:DNA-directed RNA polymerase subunit K/omega
MDIIDGPENYIQSIDLLDLARGTNNIYMSVAIIGQRANAIGSAMRRELQEKLQEFNTVGDPTTEEVIENKEQLEIARAYEHKPKPTLLALREYLEGRITFRESGSQLAEDEHSWR